MYRRFLTYWNIFWKFRKLQLMQMMEFRGDFFFWSIVSVFWTGFNFLFFGIVVGTTGNLAGWTTNEVFLLLATFTIIDAFTWSFFFHNMNAYTESVFSGSLDTLLTKPLDSQFVLSFQRNSYTNLFRLFIGIGILFWAVRQLGLTPTPFDVFLYIFLLCCGLVMIYSVWFFIATFSFWVDRLNNINEIVPTLRRVFQVPRTIYSGVSALLLTVIIPIGLISSIPSEVLLGKVEIEWVIYFILSTIFFFWLARKFYIYSLSKYSSVGS